MPKPLACSSHKSTHISWIPNKTRTYRRVTDLPWVPHQHPRFAKPLFLFSNQHATFFFFLWIKLIPTNNPSASTLKFFQNFVLIIFVFEIYVSRHHITLCHSGSITLLPRKASNNAMVIWGSSDNGVVIISFVILDLYDLNSIFHFLSTYQLKKKQWLFEYILL